MVIRTKLVVLQKTCFLHQIFYTFAANIANFGFRGQQSPILLPKIDMITKEKVIEIIHPLLETKKKFLVDVSVSAGNKIIITIDGYSGITIDECVEISRIIESSLNRDTEDFELEVSSPGLTQPFKVLDQYKKNIGKEVEILLKSGQKFAGILENITDTGIEVILEKTVRADKGKKKIKITEKQILLFSTIKYTKLVLTFK